MIEIRRNFLRESEVVINVDEKTLNAIASVLGMASDQTENMYLNDFFDTLDAAGIRGEGFVTTMDENPNYEAGDPETWEDQPMVLPMVREV